METERAQSWLGTKVFTIGHSTRPIEELVAMLREEKVDTLVDIRTIRRSRHNPQYEEEALAAVLREAGLAYRSLPALGGLRHSRKDSPNLAWRNESFRGYADYMQTQGFEEGLAQLHALAKSARVALLCAEAVPWRCHRSLVADALVARGGEVEHLLGGGRSRPHRLTRFARARGGKVTYPLSRDD